MIPDIYPDIILAAAGSSEQLTDHSALRPFLAAPFSFPVLFDSVNSNHEHAAQENNDTSTDKE